MQNFYKDLALHSPRIFFRSLVRADTTFDILSKLILALFVGSSSPVVSTAVDSWNWLTGSEVVLNGVPLWWSLVLLGVVFLHGLFRYAHEDKQKVQQERDDLEKKLADYENRDARKVVAKVEEEGPVVVAENKYGYGGVNIPVPYAGRKGLIPIRVDDENDVFLVALSYDVRSVGDADQMHWRFGPTIAIATRLEILDQDGNEIKDTIVYKGVDSAHRHAHTGKYLSWWYIVSRSFPLSGLPKGTYSLRVWDYTDGPGGREYRNMYLTMSRWGKADASSEADVPMSR